MRINNNIAALNAWRGLTQTDSALGKSLEKLSSGLRINRAGDDAAGLAISEKMRAQIKGLNMASKNAQDGISLIQTAEGALNETHSILQRMRELSVQSASDTNTAADRAELQKEVDQLAQEITRIANNTEFNTQKLLNGGVGSGGLGAVSFQIGANANQTISLEIAALDAFTLGVAGASCAGELAGTGSVTAATILSTSAAAVDGNVITAAIAEVAGAIEGTVEAGAVNITDVAVTGTAAAVVDGNTITVSVAENAGAFGGTAEAGSVGIGTITATEGGSVVDGAAIAISTAVDSAADVATKTGGAVAAAVDLAGLADTFAVKTADTALGASVDFATDIGVNDLVLNTQNVALTNVKLLGDNYDAAGNVQSVIDALQADINAVYNGVALGGVTFTVGQDGAGALTITSSNTGIAAEVNLTGTDATAAATLGFTTLGAVNGTAGSAETISLGGTNISLNNVATLGNAYDTTSGGNALAAALQADIDAADGGSIASDYVVTWDTDHLVIETVATGEAANVTFGDTATPGTLAILGLDTTAATGTDEDYAVTFNDGTTQVTVTNVAADAANVTGTGVYSTLSFATGGTVGTTTAGTINISQAASTFTVTFNDGVNTDSVISGVAANAATIAGDGDFAGITLTTDGTVADATAATINLAAGASTYTATFSDTEGSTNSVVTGLASDATSVAGTGDFEGVTLTLDGTLADGDSNTITVSETTGSAATFAADGTVTDATVDRGIDISTKAAASLAVTAINTAIDTVSSERAKLGAYQNRLEHTINNLGVAAENLSAAESRIRDVDMASEMMEFTKKNILAQAGTAMMAQANQRPQSVLQLLQ